MAGLLRPHVRSVTVAPLPSPRTTPLETLAAAFPGCRTSPDLETALAGLPVDRPTLITGSLRLVGAVVAATEGHDE
jgi:folylpolyglutamate synthase/dihydropteroate synthase